MNKEKKEVAALLFCQEDGSWAVQGITGSTLRAKGADTKEAIDAFIAEVGRRLVEGEDLEARPSTRDKAKEVLRCARQFNGLMRGIARYETLKGTPYVFAINCVPIIAA
ncbi:MAG: hypothetical protein R3B52_00900 [Candidatus Paceibacterota bacterium]